jgi:hypothetical protein
MLMFLFFEVITSMLYVFASPYDQFTWETMPVFFNNFNLSRIYVFLVASGGLSSRVLQ